MSIQAEKTNPTAAQPIVLDNVSHAYGANFAVKDVTLEIKEGELIALLGPSGCGKSTLLRIIAGFLMQSQGQVIVGGRILDRVPPNLREIGIVFQNYALFPHMTVAENVAYGLAAQRAPRALQQERVAEMLNVVQMAHLGNRKPRELSGGQQQRVALARALAVRPRVLLLDEPFAALDKNLRLDMQIEIKRLQRQFALTSILVTHDQDEAMSIADRIAVMNQGRVEQLGAPMDVYDRPQSLFVNSFIGSSNLLRGVVIARDKQSYRVQLEAGATWTAYSEKDVSVGSKVIVSVRSEQLVLETEPGEDRLPVEVALTLPIAGSVVHNLRAADGTEIKVSGNRTVGSAHPSGTRLHCGHSEMGRPILFLDETNQKG
jgi:putative spermidine/putrescine transport system ATP-binding protein